MKKSLRNLMIGAVMTAGIFAASASALAATQFVQEDMNFRNGASITSTVIGSVPGGAEVEVLGQVNGWDLIRYNGRVGYIHGGNMADTYVVKEDTSKTSAPAASQNNTPATQSQSSTYTGTQNTAQNYYDTTWSQTARNMDAYENGAWKKVYVSSGYLALRTDPSYSNNEIGQLYTGDEVMLIGGAEGSYVRAYSPKYGTHGWVNAGFLG